MRARVGYQRLLSSLTACPSEGGGQSHVPVDAADQGKHCASWCLGIEVSAFADASLSDMRPFSWLIRRKENNNTDFGD
jgi:hypothetical protein